MPTPEKRVRSRVVTDKKTGKTKTVEVVRYLARYRDPEGKQRSKTFDRQIDAQAFLDETVVSVRRGTYLDPDAGRETFREHAAEWLKIQTFSETTRNLVDQRLRLHVLSTLGDKPLAKIKPSSVKALLAGLDLAPSYRRTIADHVSAILQAAVEDDKIAKNPARTKQARPGRVVARKVTPWEASQVQAAHQAMPEHYRIAVTLGAGLGLRQGEIFGLSPDDVDFEARVVHVRRQVKLFGKSKVLALPKGEKERDVPLPKSVARELAAHLLRHPAREVTLPWKTPDGEAVTVRLVTTDSRGGAHRRDRFNTYWQRALTDITLADGQEPGMHQLRHFYASVLLDAGESIKALAEYLGHSDAAFTLRVYTHLMKSSADRTRSAVDAALTTKDAGTAESAVPASS